MNPQEIQNLYLAKKQRRKRLAALPFEEKILIMEKLQELGRSMMTARKSLPHLKDHSRAAR